MDNIESVGDEAAAPQEVIEQAPEDVVEQEPPKVREYTQEELDEIEKLKKRAARFGSEFELPPHLKPENRIIREETKQEEENLIEEQNNGNDYMKEVNTEERRLAREQRFGIITDKPLKDKHFTSKLEHQISEDNPERGEAIHLYGVDFLHTRDIMAFFSVYNPEKVEWINDSSCNIVFANENQAKQALKTLSITQSYSTEWRDSFPIAKENMEYTLQMRQATALDVKDSNTQGKNSQYYRYLQEKKRAKKEGRYNEKKKSIQERIKPRDGFKGTKVSKGVIRKSIQKIARKDDDNTFRSGFDDEEEKDLDAQNVELLQQQEEQIENYNNENEQNEVENQEEQEQVEDTGEDNQNRMQVQDLDL